MGLYSNSRFIIIIIISKSEDVFEDVCTNNISIRSQKKNICTWAPKSYFSVTLHPQEHFYLLKITFIQQTMSD